MMLAYQPVRSLAGLNIAINQGLTAAKRVLPIIDLVNEVKDDKNYPNIAIKEGNIFFKNVDFRYDKSEKKVLKSANLEIKGGKMTALVGLSGAENQQY